MHSSVGGEESDSSPDKFEDLRRFLRLRERDLSEPGVSLRFGLGSEERLESPSGGCWPERDRRFNRPDLSEPGEIDAAVDWSRRYSAHPETAVDAGRECSAARGRAALQPPLLLLLVLAEWCCERDRARNPTEPVGEGDDRGGRVELRVDSLLAQGDNDGVHVRKP